MENLTDNSDNKKYISVIGKAAKQLGISFEEAMRIVNQAIETGELQSGCKPARIFTYITANKGKGRNLGGSSKAKALAKDTSNHLDNINRQTGRRKRSGKGQTHRKLLKLWAHIEIQPYEYPSDEDSNLEP